MSCWTHITGVITVEPFGRTQHEKRYILDTIIDHLPKVSGSERNMNVYTMQKKSRNSSCTYNEFGESVNEKLFEYQSVYLVIIEGNFRDRFFYDTLKELNNFLNRLAKAAVDSVVEAEASVVVASAAVAAEAGKF